MTSDITITIAMGDAGKHEPIKVKMPDAPLSTSELDRISQAAYAFECAWLADDDAPIPVKITEAGRKVLEHLGETGDRKRKRGK